MGGINHQNYITSTLSRNFFDSENATFFRISGFCPRKRNRASFLHPRPGLAMARFTWLMESCRDQLASLKIHGFQLYCQKIRVCHGKKLISRQPHLGSWQITELLLNDSKPKPSRSRKWLGQSTCQKSQLGTPKG